MRASSRWAVHRESSNQRSLDHESFNCLPRTTMFALPRMRQTDMTTAGKFSRLTCDRHCTRLATAQVFECTNAVGVKEYSRYCPPGTVQQRQYHEERRGGSDRLAARRSRSKRRALNFGCARASARKRRPRRRRSRRGPKSSSATALKRAQDCRRCRMGRGCSDSIQLRENGLTTPTKSVPKPRSVNARLSCCGASEAVIRASGRCGAGGLLLSPLT